jgi:hypothetical protein
MSVQGVECDRLEPLRMMVFSRPADNRSTARLDIFPRAGTISTESKNACPGIQAMKIRVESYDGYRAGEKPLRFHLGRKRREVMEIIDRWYGEDHDYFKVRADDGGVYVLRYGRSEDGWELTQYSAAEAGQTDLTAGESSSKDPVH